MHEPPGDFQPRESAPAAAVGVLKVRDFRCFERYETEFSPGLNFIVGPNAVGKTSLLEAICVLLRLQSPRVARLGDVVRHGRRGLVVDGYFGPRHLQFYYGPGRKKLALDAVEQRGVEEYLQVGRLVYFATADIDLVRGGGETRRRWLDFVAGQLEPLYRRAFRAYERALRSRNALLKLSVRPWREVEAFDEPLLEHGRELTRRRAALLAQLQPWVEVAHSSISGAREKLRLAYRPGAGEDFARGLAEARAEDARLRQTTVGPHRDDVQFFINESPSSFASEGQQRTLVLALRLGSARLLTDQFGVPPVLLLDDIFGELDGGRRAALLGALPSGAQKVITLTALPEKAALEGAKILRMGEGA